LCCRHNLIVLSHRFFHPRKHHCPLIVATYPDVTLYHCQRLRSYYRPSDGSTHMTGDGQDVSLRHFKLRHGVVDRETETEKENECIASIYVIVICMMVYLDNYSFRLARRVQKCGARKFKLPIGRNDPNPHALLMQSMSRLEIRHTVYICMFFDTAGS
jgi:hypothetical protein